MVKYVSGRIKKEQIFHFSVISQFRQSPSLIPENNSHVTKYKNAKLELKFFETRQNFKLIKKKFTAIKFKECSKQICLKKVYDTPT